LRRVGTSMGDWLVRDFADFGFPAPNWMLIALTVIVAGTVISWWLQR
jgi:hypothetical protein